MYKFRFHTMWQGSAKLKVAIIVSRKNDCGFDLGDCNKKNEKFNTIYSDGRSKLSAYASVSDVGVRK